MPVFVHQTDVSLRLAPLLALCASLVFGQVAASASAAEKAAVLKVEDAFRLAKLENDIEALGQVPADEYIGVNQYGVRRDKAELIQLFSVFKLFSLTRGDVDVRFAGENAIVNGTQVEENPAVREKHLFTRVYVKRDGQWRLLSSTQLVPVSR